MIEGLQTGLRDFGLSDNDTYLYQCVVLGKEGRKEIEIDKSFFENLSIDKVKQVLDKVFYFAVNFVEKNK